jgi:hypothetical protein
MSKSNSKSSGNLGTLGALGLLFVGLKLCGVIDWPWLWVTAPFWGGLALVLAILLIAAVVAIGFAVYELITGKELN